MKESMSAPSPLQALCGAVVLALPMLAGAATADRADIRAQFRADSLACQSAPARSAQRSACMTDARGAHWTRLNGRLDDGSTPADWARNALLRCKVHKDADDRDGCERMVQGEGVRVGSVATGAVLVELTMQVPAAVQSAAARSTP